MVVRVCMYEVPSHSHSYTHTLTEYINKNAGRNGLAGGDIRGLPYNRHCLFLRLTRARGHHADWEIAEKPVHGSTRDRQPRGW